MASLAEFHRTLNSLGISIPTPGKNAPKPMNRSGLWDYLNRKATLVEHSGQEVEDTVIWNMTDEPVDRLALSRLMEMGGVGKGNFVLLLGPPAAGKGYISADGEQDKASEIKKRWKAFGIEPLLPQPVGNSVEVHEGDQELVKYQEQQKWQDFNDLHNAIDNAIRNRSDPATAYNAVLASKYYVNVSGQKEMLSKYMPFEKFTKVVIGDVPHIRQGLEQMGGRYHPEYASPKEVQDARYFASQGQGPPEIIAIHNDRMMNDQQKHEKIAAILARQKFRRPGGPQKAMKKEWNYSEAMNDGENGPASPYDPGVPGFRQQRRQAVQDYKQKQIPPIERPAPGARDMQQQFQIFAKETKVYYASMRSRGQEAAVRDPAQGKAREGYKAGAMKNFYEKVVGILRDVSGGGAASDVIIVDSPGEDVKKVQEYMRYMELAKQIGFATSVIFAMPGADDNQGIEASKAGNFIRGLKGNRMVVPESDIIPFFKAYNSTLTKLGSSPHVDAVIKLTKNIPDANIQAIKDAIISSIGGRSEGGEIFSPANAAALVRQYGTLDETSPDSPVAKIGKAINKNIMQVSYQAALAGGRKAAASGSATPAPSPMAMKKNMGKGDGVYPPVKSGKKLEPGDWSDGKTIKKGTAKNMHKGDPYPSAKGKKLEPGDWSDGKTIKKGTAKNMHKGDPYPSAKGKKVEPGDWSDGKTVKKKTVKESFNEWRVLAGLQNLNG